MYAAVVSAFNSPPVYQEIPTPVPSGDDEILVEVLAVGLHPRVRSQADGSHYTSTSELPLVPGIDGVGRGADGRLRYFVLPDTTMGAMAEHTVIDTRRSVVLPESSDPVSVAAAMNPAMSSWIALRHRSPFRAGNNVIVLGATGSAGRLAIQVAKRFGANAIIGVGRSADRLEGLAALGATDTVLLEGDPADIARRLSQASIEVDVVIDYLWGEPTAAAMVAVVAGRADGDRALTWVEVGSSAGSTAAIPSAALRSARLQIVGSGQGSVRSEEILAELPALAQEITDGTFDLDVRTLPLSEVGRAWDSEDPTQRLVFVNP